MEATPIVALVQRGGMRKRMQDYLTVFKMISPFFSGSPVTTAAEYCRFVGMFEWVFIAT